MRISKYDVIFMTGHLHSKASKAVGFLGVMEMDFSIFSSTTAAYIFSIVSFGCLIAERPLLTAQLFSLVWSDDGLPPALTKEPTFSTGRFQIRVYSET